MNTLDRLGPGQAAEVLGFDGDSATLRRLMEMGLTEGARVRVTRRAPLSDPLEISLRGYALTLRRADAARVRVETWERWGSAPNPAKGTCPFRIPSKLYRIPTDLYPNPNLNPPAGEVGSRGSVPGGGLGAGPQRFPLKQIALLGNPNSGKTSLLNALTGANLRVGNWPGVTVERKQAALDLGGSTHTMLNDLPGLYSLSGHSVEERVALRYLMGGEPDLIVCVADATNLARNLYLALELQSLGLPVVLALSLTDALASGGGSLDVRALSRALGMPVTPVSAATGAGLADLLGAIARALPERHPPPPRPEKPLDAVAFQRRAAGRYARIDAILKAARYVPPARPLPRLDALCLHRIWAYPLFFALMALMFFITFGSVGSLLTRLLERLVALASLGLRDAMVSMGVSAVARSLVLDGALAGVGAVLCFLPQVLLLFACLGVLEDTGYMARAAVLFDRPLRALGLSGRAFVPLLMGFGCTTTAAPAARAVDDERDRRLTLLLLPFASCGAKLPVYALMAGALFGARRGFVVATLHLLGVAMLALVGAILKRTALKPADAPFVLELPPYRLPQRRSVARRLSQRAKDFAVRAGTLIFLMSLIAFLLQSLTPDLRWAASAEASIFGRLGVLLTPLLSPLGLGDWRMCAALLSGLVAKEAVVSTMSVLYAPGNPGALVSLLPDHFTTASAAAFLVFTLLYPPCLSALASLRRELGSKRLLWLSVAIQFGSAYLAALVAYHAFQWYNGIGSMIR